MKKLLTIVALAAAVMFVTSQSAFAARQFTIEADTFTVDYCLVDSILGTADICTTITDGLMTVPMEFLGVAGVDLDMVIDSVNLVSGFLPIVDLTIAGGVGGVTAVINGWQAGDDTLCNTWSWP